MENYKSGSHTRHDLKAHVVWITKYRKGVLSGEIALRVREIIRQECSVMEVEIIRGHVSRDHIHLLVGYGPSLSVSKLVQRLKGKSSWRLLQEFPEIKRKFWGQRMWGRGYFVASSGNVTDEVIAEYIAQQDKEQGTENFKISDEQES
jgi:putative transposase